MTALRNPKVLSAIGFLLLIALIWFAGPFIGLIAAESRFAWIFFLMLLWVLILMAGRFVAERSSSLLEKVLRRKADEAVVSASPDKRAEVALLRQRMLTAIDTLKASHIGKTRGRAALYELPWYMIVGHPSAGKSCAIVSSGLKFPLAGKSGVSIQGVGGTRNCDWFFSTEGVLLDTAGRYSSQREDRPEWLEFLKILKKNRSKAPLNGIIVAVSFPELLQHRSEAFASYARQVRQRIDEVDDTFGMKLPVYLMVTKIDLLGGFAQFFEDLDEEGRKEVWGATLPHEQGHGFDAVRVVGQHLELLYQGLVQVGSDKLALNPENTSRPALFAFPIEFHGLKESISKFVEILVGDDPYHTKPLIRGLYFTSALQEGTPSIAAGTRISGQFGLTRDGFDPIPVPASRPYFLESLFRKVIFPDQFLVGRQSSPRRNRRRIAAIAGGLAGLTLLAGIWTWSFIGNQKLIEAAQEELQVARTTYGSPELGDRLKAMQVLQLRLEQLYQYRHQGAPWKLSWGLYRGNDLERSLREVYFRGIRKLMLEPVKESLEARLAALAGDADPAPSGSQADDDSQSRYNTLKTYLMLNQRDRMQMDHLTGQLAKFWKPWLEGHAGQRPLSEIHRMAERTVAFYVSQIKEPDLPTIEIRDSLVADARIRIRGEAQIFSPLERLYNELKTQGNTQFAPMTVGRILNNKDLDIVGGSVAVSGSFTKEAWEKYFKTTLVKASKGEFRGTDWVLATPLDDLSQIGTPDENFAKLEALYKRDYGQEWEKFIKGIAILDFGGLERASSALSRLGDPQNSPIKLILVRAALETSWDNPSELNKNVVNLKNKVISQTELLLGGQATQPQGGNLGEVGGQFSAIAQATAPGEGGRLPMDGYLELLLKLRTKFGNLVAASDPGGSARQVVQATLNGSGSELADAQQYVDGTLLGRVDEHGRDLLRPILLRPLMQSFSSLLPYVEQDLNRAWTQQVYGQWANLADKYPFADSNNEAPMGEIVKFLKPGEGTLAKFMEKYLNALVIRRGDALVARAWGGQGIGLGSNFLNSVSRLIHASETLFQEPEASRFEIQPVPTPGISEILLEVDGQKVVYRNGPQSWTPFSWPGTSAIQGARLQVVSFSGATAQIHSFDGRLGLMRILDQAIIDNPTASSTSLAWRFRVNQAFSSRTPPKDGLREEPYPHNIRFNFRMVSGTNPLHLTALRHHSLPAKVSH